VACYVPASRRVEVTEEQRRLCGGMDDDDEVSLCKEMMGVVFGLFGDLDYVDP